MRRSPRDGTTPAALSAPVLLAMAALLALLAASTPAHDGTDPDGRMARRLPTLHAIDDPVAFVELESTFRNTVARAGHADTLLQAHTAEHDHGDLGDVQHATTLQALLEWVDGGPKPTPQLPAARCAALQPVRGAACAVRPGYAPAPRSAPVVPRERQAP